MDQPDRTVEPHFSKPTFQILQMLVVLGLVTAVGYVALPQVLPVFTANPELNGFIFFVFVLGVAATFGQVLSLFRSVRWIEGFAGLREGHDANNPPTLLAPLASLLRERGAHGQISSTSASSILDSVATRVDEGREITRYIVNLLIFLGLLGTFYGLATTVPAVVDTIKSLDLGSGESSIDVVSRLMDGLESQLGGMGVAFASSLLGLAGSLVVGLLELFASHGQNRFYRELEEWLSSITRVGFSTGEGEGGDMSVLGAAFEHMSGQLEQLRQTMAANGAAQGGGDTAALSEAMHRMADRLDAQDTATQALLRIAEGQERLIAQLSDGGGLDGGMDAESRMRLRSIDVQMLRILEEISAGRQESMTELRTELTGIARALRRIGKAAEAEASGPATKVQLKRPPAPKGGKEG
ncbi:MAG: biopolymer transporter ExbB [Shimia sp.]|uniref:biopolymer transporter ExbB n=1 Tax=Shimia sp. TaxID=1954381 RepID=UPI001B24664A|nr:biopolymer transporter ExbB [Shimia sp.]MBO6897968.1 biopolymer transporter ExbB [Shimia sp.]